MKLGIDLGTTYSAVAWINAKGEPEILENQEGGRSTPSVVFFQADGRPAVVGDIAKSRALLNSAQVVSAVKNDMGTRKTYAINGKTYRPEEVSALILRKLVQDAETRTGEKVDEAVVTIPADFTDAQRMATMEAVRLAGIPCRRMINEPTAAALAYAHAGALGNGKLMVYDLGGGTFDVSVIEQEGDQVKVLATGGCKDLGGWYFDQLICNWVSDQLVRQIPPVIIETDAEAYQELLSKAETCKKELSALEESTIILNSITPRQSFTLSREDYEKLLLRHCQRTENKVRQVLHAANLSFADIDRFLLVGGSSRTPLVRRRLQELCGKEPCREINPDEAVALGAALYAGGIGHIQDVCSRSVGVALRRKSGGEFHQGIIPLGTPLPAQGSKTFHLNESSDALCLKISEAEKESCVLSDAAVLQSSALPLGQELPKWTDVTVTLALDENQILHVKVETAGAEHFQKEFELDRLLKEQADFAAASDRAEPEAEPMASGLTDDLSDAERKALEEAKAREEAERRAREEKAERDRQARAEKDRRERERQERARKLAEDVKGKPAARQLELICRAHSLDVGVISTLAVWNYSGVSFRELMRKLTGETVPERVRAKYARNYSCAAALPLETARKGWEDDLSETERQAFMTDLGRLLTTPGDSVAYADRQQKLKTPAIPEPKYSTGLDSETSSARLRGQKKAEKWSGLILKALVILLLLGCFLGAAQADGEWKQLLEQFRALRAGGLSPAALKGWVWANDELTLAGWSFVSALVALVLFFWSAESRHQISNWNWERFGKTVLWVVSSVVMRKLVGLVCLKLILPMDLDYATVRLVEMVAYRIGAVLLPTVWAFVESIV